MYGGLIDRLHDLLICGVDPYLVDLGKCLTHLRRNKLGQDPRVHVYEETEALLRASSIPWMPSHHAYLYGPQFKACIASVCLVKVKSCCVLSVRHVMVVCIHPRLFFSLMTSRPIFIVCMRMMGMLLTFPLRCG